jgi:hypothetical protein
LDLFVGAPVDLVEVLAKAVQKPADLFRDARHGEKLVRRVHVLARRAGAPAAKPVDEVPGLIRRDASRQTVQLLGRIDQLGTLCVLRLCRAVEALRVSEWPGTGHDNRRILAGRHTRRRDRRYHLTPRSQQMLTGPL